MDPVVSTRRLEVGVLGLGVGEQHARAYAAIAGCSLRWVHDLDRTRMSEVIERVGQGGAAESASTVIEDPLVDVVSIASYDDCHAEQTVAALRASKHVFVEKPLCRSLDELRVIRGAWEESPVRRIVASNLVLRAAPLYGWLRDAIAREELGEIYAFDGDYLYGRLHKITEGWRAGVKDYSVMLGGGIHLVDLMMWLTGQRPVSVTASGNRTCSRGTKFRYDDFVTATFRFGSGLIGRVTANFGCVHCHQHVVRVFGTRGTFIYDDAGARLHASCEASARPRLLELRPLPATKGDLIPGFVRSILEGEDAREQAQREFDLISACAAADAALRSEESEEVEYL